MSSDLLSVPILLIHGDADTKVPTEQSVRLCDALHRAGSPCELHLLPGVGHKRGSEGNKVAFELTAAFFERHLTNQPPRQRAHE